MAYTYQTLTDEAKQSLITRRIQEMEQQHFDQGLTATMLEAESAPDAQAMAAEARNTQKVLERGISEAIGLRDTFPDPEPVITPEP
jgi:hypothetical protein